MNRSLRRRLVSCLLIVSLMVAVATRMLLLSPSNSRHHTQDFVSAPPRVLTEASSDVLQPPLTDVMLLKQYSNCTDQSRLVYRRRRILLVETCDSMRQDDSTPSTIKEADDPIVPSDYKYIFVDDTHQVLYCAVPKVASTNWKRVMLMLTGKMNVSRLEELSSYDVHHTLQSGHLLSLSRLQPDDIRQRIDTYFKFLFVRHPLERIVSAYENKFATPRYPYFQTRLGRRIIRRYRSHPTNESLARGHDVTFDEFIRYLGDHWLGKDERPLDAHWRPYSELCLPCQVRYDVIGKHETMLDDAAYVLDVIAKTTVVNGNETDVLPVGTRFPAGQQRTNRTRDVLSRFDVVPSRHFRRVAELYAADLRLFGYEYQLRPDGSLFGYSLSSADRTRRTECSDNRAIRAKFRTDDRSNSTINTL